MLKSLSGIGLVLIGVAFGLWLYADKGNELPLPGLDKAVFVIGLALIIIHVLASAFQIGGGLHFKAKRGRCPRCGARAIKGEIYCKKHRAIARTEFLDNVAARKKRS